jgi:hypothetical protein
MSVSFQALKATGILQADLRGDLILLVHQRDQQLNFDLIDIGLTVPIYGAERRYLQACWSRGIPRGIPRCCCCWGLHAAVGDFMGKVKGLCFISSRIVETLKYCLYFCLHPE